jgi:hypothetical protein
MPNWCANVTTFEHNNANKIKDLVRAYLDNKLMQTFVPVNQDDGLYRINIWGTKWDIVAEEKLKVQNNIKKVILHFDSACSPPINFYNSLLKQGFKIKSYYHEPGNSFCGVYANGVNTEYSIDGDSSWVNKNIPNDLNAIMNISKMMKEWEDEQSE